MANIGTNLQTIISNLPKEVTLIAVSKTKPIEAILQAYEEGQRDFGENKVQELLEKIESLPKDIRWHMIGHLQRNKVASIIGKTHLIHGVDSERLLREINKKAKAKDVTVDCLIQIHIAEEESKFGFDGDELQEKVKNGFLKEFSNVKVRGLMGMATNSQDDKKVAKEFSALNQTYNAMRKNNSEPYFDTLSMGMSGDYEIAVDSGSNMIRVGSKIFGSR
ncbi:MAG: pyridoxal phosphate enzyme (YggS family) [Patiriisocius sp.]|jgi:pyridoxal phosphate enzyme (YggS family)